MTRTGACGGGLGWVGYWADGDGIGAWDRSRAFRDVGFGSVVSVSTSLESFFNIIQFQTYLLTS